MLNTRYQEWLRGSLDADRVSFAGRLANYLHLDMDGCMREALDTACSVLDDIGVRRL